MLKWYSNMYEVILEYFYSTECFNQVILDFDCVAGFDQVVMGEITRCYKN
jgi:hypothetical protein